jgi:polyhydroxyalkanoate synthesis regulator phasin
MADEGAVALGLISRLMVHLTMRGDLAKDETRSLLADVIKEFQDQGHEAKANLVRDFATALDDAVPDPDESYYRNDGLRPTSQSMGPRAGA